MSNYIDTELGKIPSDWEIKEIGEIGEVITGNTPKTSELENYGEEYLFVSPIDMGSDKYISKTNKMLSSVGFTKTRRLPKGSVLVTCIGSTIGKIGIASKKLCTNQQINSIVCSDIINNEYVYYAIHYNFKHYKNFISNQAVPIINKTTFSKLPLQIPSLKEQQKITSILSSIDETIGKTEAIIEQTEEVKKGLIQQLLTKGIGHTEFKKTELGDIPKDWELVSLKDIILSLDAGVSVNSENRDKNHDEKGILKTSAVTNRMFNPKEHKTILSHEVVRAKVSPKKGNIIVSRMNTKELVGASSYIDRDYEDLFLPDRFMASGAKRI